MLNNANSLLAKAISKLEEEFKQLLSSYRFAGILNIQSIIIILFIESKPFKVLFFLIQTERVYVL